VAVGLVDVLQQKILCTEIFTALKQSSVSMSATSVALLASSLKDKKCSEREKNESDVLFEMVCLQ